VVEEDSNQVIADASVAACSGSVSTGLD
jgi:hypothetical protein